MRRQFGAVLFPAESQRTFADRILCRRLGKQIVDRSRNGHRVTGDEAAGGGAVDRLARTTHITGYDRGAAGERFDPDIGEPLRHCRQHHHIRGAEQGRQRVVRLHAEEADGQALGEPLQPGHVRTVADQDQGRARDRFQRLDGEVLSLAHEQAARRDEQGP